MQAENAELKAMSALVETPDFASSRLQALEFEIENLRGHVATLTRELDTVTAHNNALLRSVSTLIHQGSVAAGQLLGTAQQVLGDLYRGFKTMVCSVRLSAMIFLLLARAMHKVFRKHWRALSTELF